jgi:hypothetical protein
MSSVSVEEALNISHSLLSALGIIFHSPLPDIPNASRYAVKS